MKLLVCARWYATGFKYAHLIFVTLWTVYYYPYPIDKETEIWIMYMELMPV